MKSVAVRQLVDEARERRDVRLRNAQLYLELAELRRMKWVLHSHFELVLWWSNQKTKPTEPLWQINILIIGIQMLIMLHFLAICNTRLAVIDGCFSVYCCMGGQPFFDVRLSDISEKQCFFIFVKTNINNSKSCYRLKVQFIENMLQKSGAYSILSDTYKWFLGILWPLLTLLIVCL